MRTTAVAVALALALAFGMGCAHAQTVYRCGPEGRTYSQAPCPQGNTVDVGDTRSATQRSDALAVAERDRALGDAMQRDRLQSERQAKPAGLIKGAGTTAARTEPAKGKASHDKKRKKQKGRGAAQDEGDFKAVAPGKARAG